MNKNSQAIEPVRSARDQEMLQAMRRGVVKALLEHKLAGHSVVIWNRENDRIVEVPPEEIVIPEEHAVGDEALRSAAESQAS